LFFTDDQTGENLLAMVAALLGDERLTAVVELYAAIHRQPEH